MRQLFNRLYAKLTEYKKDPVRNPGAEAFEVDNWVVSRFVLKKIVPAVGIKPFPLNELQLMVSAVCRLKPTHIFEWGTHIGKSARIFYETAKYFNTPLEIHSIDLPDDVEHVENPHSKRGKLVKGKPGVFLHLGDGLNTALGIYRTLPPGSRALFFLDGDHAYESVKRELEGIIANVLDAKILVHDTFYQSADSGYNIGPFKAVQEAIEKGKFKVIETKTGLPGMTFLY